MTNKEKLKIKHFRKEINPVLYPSLLVKFNGLFPPIDVELSEFDRGKEAAQYLLEEVVLVKTNISGEVKKEIKLQFDRVLGIPKKEEKKL